jgi:hypothetical protein
MIWMLGVAMDTTSPRTPQTSPSSVTGNTGWVRGLSHNNVESIRYPEEDSYVSGQYHVDGTSERLRFLESRI